jgi:hypothetical protein
VAAGVVGLTAGSAAALVSGPVPLDSTLGVVLASGGPRSGLTGLAAFVCTWPALLLGLMVGHARVRATGGAWTWLGNNLGRWRSFAVSGWLEFSEDGSVRLRVDE